MMVTLVSVETTYTLHDQEHCVCRTKIQYVRQAVRCKCTTMEMGVTKSGGYPFFCQGKENIYVLRNFGHFASQKVPKCSKVAQNSLLGGRRYLKRFCPFLPILVDFLLNKRFFSKG
jgi:hypothetical protein